VDTRPVVVQIIQLYTRTYCKAAFGIIAKLHAPLSIIVLTIAATLSGFEKNIKEKEKERDFSIIAYNIHCHPIHYNSRFPVRRLLIVVSKAIFIITVIVNAKATGVSLTHCGSLRYSNLKSRCLSTSLASGRLHSTVKQAEQAQALCGILR